MNKNNFVIVSLWIGLCKPKMEILFQPLVDLLQKLSHHGIVIDTPFGYHILRISPIPGIFYMVAKAPMLNMTQFNGVSGCNMSSSWCMDFDKNYLPGQEYVLRTDQSINEAAKDAERNKVVVEGIKERYVLNDILDLVKYVPIEYMHSILERVTKLLVNKWFTSTNHSLPFRIRYHLILR